MLRAVIQGWARRPPHLLKLMVTQNRSKLAGFIFANLLVTALLAVLAYGTVEPWSLALLELNALLLAVLLALRFVLDPQADWNGWRLALPLFALVLLGIIQSISYGSPPIADAPESIPLTQLTRTLSRDPQATREATIKLLALAVYFIAALHTLRDAHRRRVVLSALTIFGFAVSLFAIIQRLTGNDKMYWVRPASNIAFYGPYGNYNHFAGLIELILPLACAHLLFARIEFERRLLWLFSVVLMAVAVIYSLSRGGILALGVQMLALLLIANIARQRWDNETQHALAGNKLIIVTAFISVVLLAIWIGYEPLAKRLGAVRQGASEYSVVSRAEYWRASWRIFLDHPLTGVGLGAFPAVYPAYGRSSVKLERLEQTHNDYLQLLTDAGLLGALLGLWFLFEIIRVARRQWPRLAHARSHDRALVVGGYVAMLGIAVHSFLDFNLQIAANALVFLLIVALTGAIDFAPAYRKEFAG